jgi:hypothetical protein
MLLTGDTKFCFGTVFGRLPGDVKEIHSAER